MHGDFLRLLERSMEYVPFRFLYYAEVHPKYDEPDRGFQLIDFVYRISNDFCAFVPLRGGEFKQTLLKKHNLAYELYAIPFDSGFQIISLEQALKQIIMTSIEGRIDPLVNRVLNEIIQCFFGEEWARRLIPELDYLVDKKIDKEVRRIVDEYFDNDWQPNALGPFISVTLKKPFNAMFTEPYYFFRLPFSANEIMVGAVTGTVRVN